MSIKDVSAMSARQIEAVRRKQAREIANLEEGHRNLKAEVKKAHEADLIDIESQNMRHLDSETTKKEKVLEQMRMNMDNTRKLTDKEMHELKKQMQITKQSEAEKLSAERERLKMNHEEYMEEINHRFNTQFRKMNDTNQSQLETLKDNNHQNISEKEAYFQDKISNQRNNFTAQFQNDSRNYKLMKDNQDKTFKNERMQTNLRQQTEVAKMTDAQNKVIENRDKEFRRGLKEQGQMFEKKYAQSLQVKNKDMGRLEQQNQAVLTRLKQGLAKTIANSVDRKDDPFYQFTELTTRLKKLEDRVEIEVDVPDHAKADLQINFHGKEAIVSFNRRYQDSRSSEGGLNKLSKVESFTSRIDTGEFLNPKSVKSSYADGVMTYVIKHA